MRNIPILKFVFVQLSFFLLSSSRSFALVDSIPLKAKSDIQHHIYRFECNAAYGIGNIWVAFLKKNYNTAEYKIQSYGPFSATIEYRFNQDISGGVSVAYSKIKGNVQRFLIDEELTIFTAFARANYHFIHKQKLDSYVGLGAGYVRSVYQNSLGLPSDDVPGIFGYSAQLGIRYYFLKNLGIYTELGYVNGSFCLAGFVCRF